MSGAKSSPAAVGESASSSAHATPAPTEPMIDPELMDLPPPPHLHKPPTPPQPTPSAAPALPIPGEPMGITQSIASAPNPHHTDFSILPFNAEGGIDLDQIDTTLDDGPGSPTAKVMRAIAPPNAAQPNPTWAQPPPNASVNLYIGRALLSHGNDNWPLTPADENTSPTVIFLRYPSRSLVILLHPPPSLTSSYVLAIHLFLRPPLPSYRPDYTLTSRLPLLSRPLPTHLQKPNDIVSWIRKHYPSEWDGDEGRCSAHRVRTYLARKGADMYYEKLNQGCIAGWRIRQNHLWRFADGGFQGRGMKQEEAIAQAQKENEMVATAAHKAAAALALAQGHPGVKIAMSTPGHSEGTPPAKKARTKGTGQARKKSEKKKAEEAAAAAVAQDYYQTHEYQPQTAYDHMQQDQHQQQHDGAGESSSSVPIDPSLQATTSQINMDLVHQAMQAAGVADDMDMGIELPIEMQMHGGEDGVGRDDGTQYYGHYQEGGENKTEAGQDAYGYAGSGYTYSAQ
ncbi:hypothetical protein P7C73_g5892, partial [Tremellales sp. Uapishka_1]